ncbi:hypothetical protein BR141012304_12077 [Brucella inopinata]|nr:hypothetical protein BR141012304_12077 [Brucella inopinata]
MGENQSARLFGDDFLPVFRLWRGSWRLADLEVLGSVCIGENIENVAARRDIIFSAGLARHDELRFG